jgi:hypothetical protein
MIIQTKLIPKGFDAFTAWPFIFMRDKTDEALLTHETVHYEEQRKAGTLSWLMRYAKDKDFRLAAEVRGYKAQIATGHMSVERAADFLIQYGAGISHAEAVALLT